MKRGRKAIYVMVDLTCDTCGSRFQRKSSRIPEDQTYFFCSVRCAKNWKEDENCLVCTSSGGSYKIHHERHAELLEMLRKNCLTYVQIGEQFGVTGERIRQIAKRLNFIRGHDRQRICTIQRRLPNARWSKYLPTWKGLGLDVKPVLFGYNRIHSTRILINGKKCSYGVHSPNVLGYTTLFRSGSDDCDFHIVEFEEGRWLVVPKADVPKHSTTVKLIGEKQRPGYARRGKPWQDYINNWSPLILEERDERTEAA